MLERKKATVMRKIFCCSLPRPEALFANQESRVGGEAVVTDIFLKAFGCNLACARQTCSPQGSLVVHSPHRAVESRPAL